MKMITSELGSVVWLEKRSNVSMSISISWLQQPSTPSSWSLHSITGCIDVIRELKKALSTFLVKDIPRFLLQSFYPSEIRPRVAQHLSFYCLRRSLKPLSYIHSLEHYYRTMTPRHSGLLLQMLCSCILCYMLAIAQCHLLQYDFCSTLTLLPLFQIITVYLLFMLEIKIILSFVFKTSREEKRH